MELYAPLPSSEYFHPEYMSLTSPHPIWTTTGPLPYHVAMSTVQATMISGRYRTELLCSKWSSNSSGFCQTPSCRGLNLPEDLHHILAKCSFLQPTRKRLLNFTSKFCQQYPAIKSLIDIFCTPEHPKFCQFLLDCSVLPEVILAVQQQGSAVLHQLFRITRTWCYCLHKTRLQILGRWAKP